MLTKEANIAMVYYLVKVYTEPKILISFLFIKVYKISFKFKMVLN